MERTGLESGEWVFQNPANSSQVHWCHAVDIKPDFQSIVFDEAKLAAFGLIDGLAHAGRGNTFFLTLDNYHLVLRHYRRGGLPSKLSSKRYGYTGLERTRAIRELKILNLLQQKKLPAPVPYAAQIVVRKFSYEASIVTHRLSGETMAQRLMNTALEEQDWKNIGSVIARFHQQGVFHADLNAHNIMLTDVGAVSLIDFDRARIRTLNNGIDTKWCRANVNRLHRSVNKIINRVSLDVDTQRGMSLLIDSWTETMAN